MRVYLAQFAIAWEKPAENYRRVEALLESQPIAPKSLILLPEMFATGFSMTPEKSAKALANSCSLITKIAKKYDAAILAGMTSLAGNKKGYNQAWAFAPDGSLLSRYTKIHPFSMGQEKAHFVPGQELGIFSYQKFTICPIICYDLRFPELFRIAEPEKIHLYAVIANWPAVRAEHWRKLLAARAIENQAYVAGVNCVSDPKSAQGTYAGQSQVLSPQGEELIPTVTTPALLSAEISLPRLRKYRKEFPVLADRHPEFLAHKRG